MTGRAAAVVAAWLLLAAHPAPAAAAEDHELGRSANAERHSLAEGVVGRAAFQQLCARCHGEAGRGDGPDAKRLYPRPRDLTEGVFKLRSTVSHTPPRDADLLRTLTNGLPSSGMPDWSHLDEALRRQLVAYVKTLSPAFASTVYEEGEPPAMELGDDPGPRRADLPRGRALYERMVCASCHGVSGRANGASAPILADDWDRPMRPANLTRGWHYRGGAEPRDIVQRLLTGMDGTAMPSYGEVLSTDDAWQLAYYVRSLQEPPQWGVRLRAARRADALPTRPDDPAWQQAERLDVRLMNVPNADGSIRHPLTTMLASVQALTDGESVALRVRWDDPTEDRGDEPDRLAVALRPPGVRGDVVSLQAWPLRDTPALDVIRWSAQTDATSEVVAARYGPEAASGAPALHPSAVVSYEDGRWTAVIVRPARPTEPAQPWAQLAPGHASPLALSVWDGGNGDRAARGERSESRSWDEGGSAPAGEPTGQQAVSCWMDVRLDD